MDAYYIASDLIDEAGRSQQALDLNLQGIRANPDSADLYVSAADLYLREKRYEEAKEAFERAMSLKAKFVTGYTILKDLAVMYGALGETEMSRRLYLQAVIHNMVRLAERGLDDEEVPLLVGLVNEDCDIVLPEGHGSAR